MSDFMILTFIYVPLDNQRIRRKSIVKRVNVEIIQVFSVQKMLLEVDIQVIFIVINSVSLQRVQKEK